jgi:hypothetical protein
MSHVVPFHLRDLHSASKADATGLSNARNPSALYPRKATRIDQEPKIPDPKLFASLARTTPGNSDLPTMGECAVHLELLEVFHKLRLDIINSKNLDTTFGVKIDNRTVYRKIYSYPRRRYIMKPVQLRDTTWPTRRRQKWSYFLDIAAGRFKVWMAKMNDFLLKSQDRQLPHLPPLGTYTSTASKRAKKRERDRREGGDVTDGLTIMLRCPHGLACFSAQPS